MENRIIIVVDMPNNKQFDRTKGTGERDKPRRHGP